MTAAALWTLDELTSRVGDALAAAADAGTYAGARNGRIREVPDRRAIRWYVTRGLLDRPVTQGRTVGYGARHLLQLVLIKQRQAQGRALAEIQSELLGATDAQLRALTGVSDAILNGGGSTGSATEEAPASAPRGRFWAGPAHRGPDPSPAVPDPSPARSDLSPARSDLSPARSDPSPAAGDPAADATAPVDVLTGVPLGGGAVLLLPAAPDPEALAAIHGAAQPLLDLLTTRGLLTPPRRSPR